MDALQWIIRDVNTQLGCGEEGFANTQQPLAIEDISGGADVALLGIEMIHSPLNSSGKQFSNLGDNKVRPVRGDGDENDINGTHAASALVE